jgi:hypothetical protein
MEYMVILHNMRGLLLRLSDLDPNASAYLRVIEYFDRLVNNGVSLEALTRASAALSGCTAGLRDEGSRHVIRFDCNGQSSPPLLQPVGVEIPVVIDDATVGFVWLERETAEPLDEILVERMAVTAAARWRPLRSIEGSDPALLELVISSTAEDQDQIRALRLLSLSPVLDLRVMAFSVNTEEPTKVMQSIVSAIGATGGTARSALLGTYGAILIQYPQRKGYESIDNLLDKSDVDSRIGLGHSVPASRAADSWASARVALRFSDAWQKKSPIVNYDDLGVLALLANIPSEVALANPDVKLLAGLARLESGEQDIDVLLAVTWNGSARQAATELYMHHSSVTNRLKRIEDALGISIHIPADRLRAQIAAITWRIHR